jgi:hypothetical protein
MGTDIHAFVEVDYGSGEPFGAAADIFCFNRGEFFIPNDYDLLNALGDGRNRNFPPAEVRRWALIPPRGLPANATQTVLDLYYHPVLRSGAQPGRTLSWWHELPPVTREDADRWVRDGLSHFAPAPPDRVSNPDWHTPSWLRLAEVYPALAHFDITVESLSPEFRVVLRVMEEFEALVGLGRSRLVFWYDN